MLIAVFQIYCYFAGGEINKHECTFDNLTVLIIIFITIANVYIQLKILKVTKVQYTTPGYSLKTHLSRMIHASNTIDGYYLIQT